MEKGLEGSQLFNPQGSHQWEGLKKDEGPERKGRPEESKGTSSQVDSVWAGSHEEVS